MKLLTILLNDQIAYTFDRDTQLEDQQLAFLDRMDKDMDSGIKFQTELVTTPDNKQRARFVAMNLIRALQQDDNAKTFALCAYLSNRLPALVEVRASDHAAGVNIDFVEEH